MKTENEINPELAPTEAEILAEFSRLCLRQAGINNTRKLTKAEFEDLCMRSV